jgi:hypothetical protein
MADSKQKYIDNCPRCKGDVHFFDEGIVDGFYCADCDILVDEHGVIIKEAGNAHYSS